MKKQLQSYLLIVALFLSFLAFKVQAQNGAAPTSFTNKTTANGLGSNSVYGVYAVGSTVYAGTSGGLSISTDVGTTITNKNAANNGLPNNSVRAVYVAGNTIYAGTAGTGGGVSISTDGGTTFTNKTTTSGLGSNQVLGVFSVGSNVYAATNAGLSISTNSGSSFINKTTASGLGSNTVRSVYAVGNTIYAATSGGLTISTDGGSTFSNKNVANNQLANNTVRCVYVVNNTIYAGTDGGLSISSNGGTSFTTRNVVTNGLGSLTVNGVYVVGSTVYAATGNGLSISTDGGTNFTNYTTSSGSGLGSNTVLGVYAVGNTVYAATSGGLSIGAVLTTPTITTAPSASEIIYGQTLASSTLSGGVASVAGTFAFTTPSTAPGAGTANQDYTFTPTDATSYKSVTGTVSVKVNKATPSITTAPSPSDISLGRTLQSSQLSGGVASVAGTFAFTTPSTVPGIGTASQGYTFTPTDVTNYNTLTGTISVTVNNKATPSITVQPTASDIAYGQSLASSILSGGVASVTGTFTFTAPSTVPVLGAAIQVYTFTPTDATNYNKVAGTVSVTVVKATPTITTAPSASDIIFGQTLQSSDLSGGVANVAGTFAFTTPGFAPSAGTANQGYTFTPTDATNYTTTTGTVSVTVASAQNSGPAPTLFSNKTTADGLGNIMVYNVCTAGSNVYAATNGGVSISTNGGTTFTNKTTANGLGNNIVFGVFVSGTNVYAATNSGLSISTDGGNTFTNKTTTNGLGSNTVYGVFAVGSNVYAATNGGVSISSNGGASFTNKTIANGLGNNSSYNIYVSGNNVYVSTGGGLSISTDGGATFTNKTVANSGLADNAVTSVCVVGSTIYASTSAGLSISKDNGTSFTNKTTANGLAANYITWVYAVGYTVYAATGSGLSISTDGGKTFTNRTSAGNGLGSDYPNGVFATTTTLYASTNSGLSIGTATSPSAPTITTITAGNGSLSVAFTAPTSNGSSTITDYKYSTDGGANYISAGTLNSPINITGLTNGTTYNVTLKAVNLVGDGPESNSVSGKPVAPQVAPSISAHAAISAIYNDGGTYSAASTSNSTGAITYTSNNANVATVNASTGAITIVGAGSTTITVSQAADVNYLAGTATVDVTVAKATPSISAHGAISATYNNGGTYNAVSTSNSTGAITYTSNNNNVATVNVSTGAITIVGAGNTTITVSQVADANYLAGTGTLNVTVAKATPSISAHAAIAAIYNDGGTYSAASTSNSTGAITYTSNNANVATVNANTGAVTIVGAGSTTITVSQAADANFLAGTATVNVSVAKATPSISAHTAISATYNDGGTYNAVSTSNSTGSITYTSNNTNVATVNASTGALTIVRAGSTTITVSQAADANYLAGSATVNVSVACVSTATTLSATACNSYTWHNHTYTTSGAYTYTTTNAAGCDSVITLNLTIKQSTTSSLSVSACNSYTWHGTTYTASGAYTYTTTNAVGCDSVVTLNLSLKSATDVVSIIGTTNSCVSGKSTQLSSNFVGGTWASSLGNVAVDNNGLVTGNGATNALATIKYYCSTDSASTTFSYLPFTVIGSKPITVPASVCSGTTVQLQTSVLTYPQNILNNTTGAWSVQNPLRATIDQNGVLTGGTPGGHPIVTYTLTNNLGCVRNLYDTTITVNASPTTKPAISGATAVCTQSTVQLSATPAGASNTWGIQNPIRGSISNTGLLTGASPSANAIVTYKYTDANGCSSATAYYNVYVNVSAASPRITTLSGTYCVGSSYNFAATPVGGTWSTNNAIASITSSNTSAATAKINSAGSFGIIYKTAADANGCKATTTFIRSTTTCVLPTVALDTLSGSLEVARVQSGSVSVYPNPARGVVTVNSPSVDANSSFSIADITGKIVKTQAITDKQIKVNISGLKSGIYFISIQSAEGKTTKKLIINN